MAPRNSVGYVVVAWEIDPSVTQTRPDDELDKAMRRSIEEYDPAFLMQRVAVIPISRRSQRPEILGALKYVADKELDLEVSFVISPVLPAGLWDGYTLTKWDEVNAVTFGGGAISTTQ